MIFKILSSRCDLMASPACRYKHNISSCACFLVVFTLKVYLAYSLIYFTLQLEIDTSYMILAKTEQIYPFSFGFLF